MADVTIGTPSNVQTGFGLRCQLSVTIGSREEVGLEVSVVCRDFEVLRLNAGWKTAA